MSMGRQCACAFIPIKKDFIWTDVKDELAEQDAFRVFV
jgi:hypothetical protein